MAGDFVKAPPAGGGWRRMEEEEEEVGGAVNVIAFALCPLPFSSLSLSFGNFFMSGRRTPMKKKIIADGAVHVLL